MPDETSHAATDHHQRALHGQKHTHAHCDHRGHENDQGIRGVVRYLRWLPQMWRSPINDAVVDQIAPKPGERGIDIGAGMGPGALRAAANGMHVVAVEPTPFMRRILQVRRTLNRHRASVEVVDGAAEWIPVEDRSVDAIWAVNAMHHWVDIERGVAEIARVLRTGGRVLLVDEDFDDKTHPDHERFGQEHGHEHLGFSSVDAAATSELLRAAGLVDIDTSTRRIADRPVISVAARGTPMQ